MKKLALILLWLMLSVPALAEPIVFDYTIAITASVANYWPSTSGIAVADYEYFGYQIVDTESSGSDPGATVTLEVSNDQSNWTAYTQTVFYPITGAGSASIAITAETAYQGSIHPAPCQFMRIVITETATDTDTSVTIHLFAQ